jgi:tRNA-Thr(GGU) m(6)t(6)A37 methyltransferase TsaA
MADDRQVTAVRPAGPPAFGPIGLVHSPFLKWTDIPRERNAEPDGFRDVEGTIEVFPEFEAGLRDIEGFSHIVVLFVFHQSEEVHLLARPPLETRDHGVFATRSPHRPNPLGMTIVELLGREGRCLKVRNVDMVEATPVLDLKPYTDKDRVDGLRTGWIRR